MKLTTFLMIIGCMQLHAAVYSQSITLSERNVSLETVLSKLEKQSGYTFFSRLEVIRSMPKVNVRLKNVTLEDALDDLLGKLSLTYTIVDKTVVINLKPQVTDAGSTQPRIYIGKVLDEQDKPLPGVSVRLKGTGTVVVTDANGQFILPVNTESKAVMQISYLGCVTQEIPLTGIKTPIVIRLKVASAQLDQVQISAYGSGTRRLATGSASVITAADIEKNPGRNVLEIVQGQVPGLFVQQTSGLPGSPFNLTIRGQQRLTTGSRGSQPLIIVDGVALPSGALPLNQNNDGSMNVQNELRGGNPLDYIDPSIIETFTTLKDADATSIYGSRGAYGVILITTKKGREGAPKLVVNASMGVTVRGTSPKLLNTEEYIMLRKEAIKNDGGTLGNVADINGPDANRYTDFLKELNGNNATVNKINANYSGGNADITFLIGANYRKQTSIQVGKGAVKDGGINFNIGNTVKNNKFSINLSGSYLSTADDAVPFDFAQSGISLSAPNYAPLFLPDGSLNWETGTNPASAMHIIFKNVTNNLLSNLTLKYNPVKGLTLNTLIGYNYIHSKALKAQPTAYYNPSSAFTTTSSLNTYNIRNLTVEPNALYKLDLGAKGVLTAQTGATLQNMMTDQITITGNNFLSDDMLYNPTFADPLTASGAVNILSSYVQTPNKYIGFFGILNYNWDNKYILNLNGRRDGSTKFGENNQFGNFGSVGAAWIISAESWFQSLLPIVSFAKLKGSFGTAGGDGIDNYAYLTTFSKSTLYQGSLGLKPDNLENKNLHWEKNRKTEGGLTLEFLKGRIFIDAIYFNNRTTDQLVNQLLPSTTGFIGRVLNSPAVVKNNGWEFELNTKNVVAKNFSWTSHFTLTIPKNRLIAYPGLGEVVTNTSYEIGKSVQGIKVYKYAGVDPETGLYNFINRNGVKGTFPMFGSATGPLDAVLDKTEFIDLTPKFYGGLNNTFTYKTFSLDVFFTFTNRIGRTFLGSQTYGAGVQGFNSSIAYLGRWQKPGDVTDIQRAGGNLTTILTQSNFNQSSGAFGRAVYARLSSLNLSYALPAKLARQLRVSGLSIFGQGSNLLTISKYGDYDPENLGIGTAPLRNFSGGLRITL